MPDFSSLLPADGAPNGEKFAFQSRSPGPMSLTPEAYWTSLDFRIRSMRLPLNCADTPERDAMRLQTRDRRDRQIASSAGHGSFCTRFAFMAASYLLCMGFSLSSQAETSARQNLDTLSLTYGRVSQHYLTAWSDPALPAGVLRGMPPLSASAATAGLSESPTAPEDAGQATAPDAQESLLDPAILYVLDLGKAGMEMVVSAKNTLQPGQCVVLERSGDYVNLRGVNSGFCDLMNQATIATLQPIHSAAARRCKAARHQFTADSESEEASLTPAELGMLCDGS